MKRLFLFSCTLWMALSVMAANFVCTGVVVDESDEPMVGATVALVGNPSIGTATDIDGQFKLSIPGSGELQISFIGYKTKKLTAQSNMGTIKLEPEATLLEDVVVTQSVGRTRLTPVAMSTISAADLEIKLGNQELPEVLKTTPGVWATKDGGGFGDAKINIRGFKSQNTATMVN
ncbi:MAG: carboxypeptidase-like regulatory domain-containing protein, partial [Muribaculaceae bacterium]|nr:carboxypeptidase-like regulatory domain-containing protein [Muribaculaceae bacterium]